MVQIIVFAGIVVVAIVFLVTRYYKILTGKKACCDNMPAASRGSCACSSSDKHSSCSCGGGCSCRGESQPAGGQK